MIGSRNPARDRVAIAAASTTGFTPHNTSRSQLSYVTEACVEVMRNTGLQAKDIDGLLGTNPTASTVQSALGLSEITWFANPPIPFGNHVAAAVGAIHSGQCDVVLAYHGAYRLAWNTASALRDPFRRGGGPGGVGHAAANVDTVAGAVGYTAWASRYLHEFGLEREAFAPIAINSRSNARHNPSAAMREPMTIDDYRAARMIRWPLCLFDMDVPVDGADAFIITTAERARDLPFKPVLINAVTLGMIDQNEEEQTPSLRRHGQHVVVESLKNKSDFWIDDVDVYYPYDGFTVIAMNWFENVGYCGPGEASAFLAEHWDAGDERILIDGRVPVNTHGGSLSEGGTQGSGHLREAVHQLQGRAGARQVVGAERALITAGGFFFNAQGITLRVD